MADRFPLIVNAVSQKIEELVSGDNLELSGNNIVISGDTSEKHEYCAIRAVQDAGLQAEPPQIDPEWQSSSLSDHEDK